MKDGTKWWLSGFALGSLITAIGAVTLSRLRIQKRRARRALVASTRQGAAPAVNKPGIAERDQALNLKEAKNPWAIRDETCRHVALSLGAVTWVGPYRNSDQLEAAFKVGFDSIGVVDDLRDGAMVLERSGVTAADHRCAADALWRTVQPNRVIDLRMEKSGERIVYRAVTDRGNALTGPESPDALEAMTMGAIMVYLEWIEASLGSLRPDLTRDNPESQACLRCALLRSRSIALALAGYEQPELWPTSQLAVVRCLSLLEGDGLVESKMHRMVKYYCTITEA